MSLLSIKIYHNLLRYTVPYLVFPALRIKVIRSQTRIRGPVIMISNHRSYIDPFLIAATIRLKDWYTISPLRAMAAKKYMEKPILSYFLEKLGAFPSQEIVGKKYGILYAKELLGEGFSIIMFPEGARNKVSSNQQLRYHTGASVIAKDTGATVVPVFITRKQVSASFYNRSVVQGEPFNAEGMTIEQMMDKVWELEKLIK